MSEQRSAASQEERADVRAFFGLVAGAQFADIVPAKALRRMANLLEGADLPADLDAATVLQVLEKLAMRHTHESSGPADVLAQYVIHTVAEVLIARYPGLKIEGKPDD